MLGQLLHGYHTEGRNIADVDELVEVGVRSGLSRNDVESMLAGDSCAEAVRHDECRGAALGVTGVPTIVIDEQRLPGIQPVDTLRALFDDALDHGPQI